MNESGWGKSRDPVAMLKWLLPFASPRKLRLFACACARRYWNEIDHPQSRRSVEAAEDFADGLVDVHDLNRANSAAGSVTRSIRRPSALEWEDRGRPYLLRSLARAASAPNIRGAALSALINTLNLACRNPTGFVYGVRVIEHRAVGSLKPHLCGDLRDLFGRNPSRPRRLAPALLAWTDRTVPNVARAIHRERDFDSLPILADALEEAGCADGEILAHCRGGGRHVRGCWALDACMGLT